MVDSTVFLRAPRVESTMVETTRTVESQLNQPENNCGCSLLDSAVKQPQLNQPSRLVESTILSAKTTAKQPWLIQPFFYAHPELNQARQILVVLVVSSLNQQATFFRRTRRGKVRV